NGGNDTSAAQTFVINVTPVNDQPEFTKGPDKTVLEDAGAVSFPNWATNILAYPSAPPPLALDEATQGISFLVTNSNNALSSAQTFANRATAISAGPPDEVAANQVVNFLVLNSNNALFTSQPAITSSGTLSFTPAPNANGTATVTVTLKDTGGTANSGNDTSA